MKLLIKDITLRVVLQKMDIKLILVGKTDKKYLIEGIEIYLKRLKHYVNFELITIPE